MFDPYVIIIFFCLIVALSYFFNIISKKTKIPSVLLLITTGIILKYSSDLADFVEYEEFSTIVQFLGIVGLIMIVLEAAIDLKIDVKKLPVIGKSFAMAILVLVLTSFGVAGVIMLLQGEEFINSLIYAVPLSIVSSAVLIPSLSNLAKKKQEFLIYESTFSDIIGIMLFNYVIMLNGQFFAADGVLSIFLTIIISVVLSYILVFVFGKISSHIKLFLMIAVLAVLFSLGKKLHLSSLLIIFIFGLVLNNTDIFFKGIFKGLLDDERVVSLKKDFRTITGETAFLLRTFFFVAFGMSINLEVLADFGVIGAGVLIVGVLYSVRFFNFKLFLRSSVYPEIWLAPRGLITVLLFYSIPERYLIHDFSIGILFFVILSTSIIMMVALIKTPDDQPLAESTQDASSSEAASELKEAEYGLIEPSEKSQPEVSEEDLNNVDNSDNNETDLQDESQKS